MRKRSSETVRTLASSASADTRVPTLTPGVYTLAVSLGDREGTPRLALPLAGGVGRRYPVGALRVK